MGLLAIIQSPFSPRASRSKRDIVVVVLVVVLVGSHPLIIT